MITYTIQKPYDGSKTYVEGKCLSGDPKPSNVVNGSILLEMDTATLYMFDETNNTWRAWS